MRKFTLILFVFAMAGFTQAQTAQFNYVSPVPGSKYINPEQSITLKTGHTFNPSKIFDASIQANGSVSGYITGKTFLSKDNQTLFFKPDKAFAYGETVSVVIIDGMKTMEGQDIERLEFSFTIKPGDNTDLLRKYYNSPDYEFYTGQIPENPMPAAPQKNGDPNTDMFQGYVAPQLEWYEDMQDCYFFYTGFVFMTQKYIPYVYIFDEYGTPVYLYKTKTPGNSAIDFKILPDGSLAFGNFNLFDMTVQEYYLMNSHMDITDTVLMGNGYFVDCHDILLVGDDHYLMMAYDPQLVDMSQVVPGGDTNATVIGLIIQEVDLDQNVYFQWRSWDHFEITDATDNIDLTAPQIDYCHGNAFDFDDDGHLLISSRHMDEITKINYQTGNIIWRLGLLSENNQFTILNDTNGFSHQHDIRRLPNGNFTIYDNGNNHTPPFSQAIEYNIDEANMEATLAWNYRNQPEDVFYMATGSHRRLENGESLIGWGLAWQSLAASQVTMDGTKVLDIYTADSLMGYRTLAYNNWATTLFSTNVSDIDFGNYAGHYTPLPRIFTVTNNHPSDPIQITSTHLHSDAFYLSEDFPVTINAGESYNFTAYFFPGGEGMYKDVLTLNYDNADTSQRIARQINLSGIVDSQGPMADFDPVDGTTEVETSQLISVMFNEAILLAGGGEVTNEDIADFIVLKKDSPDGDAVSFTAVINEDKDIVEITPTGGLEADQNYYAVLVPETIEDNWGNLNEGENYSYFTTATAFGVDELDISASIILSPNPTNGVFQLSCGDYTPKRVRVLNTIGEIVVDLRNPDALLRIDLENQASGLYIIHLDFEETSSTFERKLIKY